VTGGGGAGLCDDGHCETRCDELVTNQQVSRLNNLGLLRRFARDEKRSDCLCVFVFIFIFGLLWQ
jgi:hypothetical protein